MDQLNANNHVAGPNTNEGGRQVIEQTLEGIIENLRRFTITIEEYTSDSQSLVFEKMCVSFKNLLYFIECYAH